MVFFDSWSAAMYTFGDVSPASASSRWTFHFRFSVWVPSPGRLSARLRWRPTSHFMFLSPSALWTRDTIEALLARADLNRDGRLSYEEFRALAPVLGLRVTAPLAVFVAIKMLLAPVLAWNIVAQASKSERLLAFGESLTLPGVLDRLVVSDDFWRTVLTVAFMASLNNVCTMLTKALLAPMPFARALLASR